MTVTRAELAKKRPANLTATPSVRRSNVIDGEFRTTRPTIPFSHLGVWASIVLFLLFAGFLASMAQA